MLRPVASSAGSSLYATILSLAVVPAFLSLLGDDRYGLVGLFLLFMPIIALLDLGFGVAVLRESARAKAGAVSRADYAHLMRGLETLFVLAFVLLTGAALVSAPAFASHWLVVPATLDSEVATATALMLVSLLLRWLAIIYRSKLIGFEAIEWVAGFNIAIATLRFAGPLPLLFWGGADLQLFFGLQLVVSALELAGFMAKSRTAFDLRDLAPRLGPSLREAKRAARFVGATSLGGLIWVFAAQFDKLWLMRLLPLAEFGHYSLAVMIAGGVSLLAGPANLSLLPALSRAATQADLSDFRAVFLRFGELNAVVLCPIAAMMLWFPEQIIFVWTGRSDVAAAWGPVMALYGMANTALAFSIFGHYAMIAMGRMKLYIAGIAIFALYLALALYFGIRSVGALGAAWAWFIANAVYLGIWVILVIDRLVPRLAAAWAVATIAPIAALCLAIAGISAKLVPFPEQRWAGLAMLLAIGVCVFAVGAAMSPGVRTTIATRLPGLKRN